MDPTHTFPSEQGEISYLEYFQQRHGLTLQRKQPLLYCPFRAKQEVANVAFRVHRVCRKVYLPAEIAYLTGLDEEYKQEKAGEQHSSRVAVVLGQLFGPLARAAPLST